MAENGSDYLTSSPSTLGRRSPASSDWERLGGHSLADQEQFSSASFASCSQTSHGSMDPMSDVFGHNAKINAEPGELWLSAKENEDPWPVVICDEELLQTLLKGKARPVNARREDGSWYKGYGPGGGLAEKRCFPTMRLGTAKLCWTPWKRLKPFDILNVKSIQESAEDMELVKAYAEAVEQYGRNDLTYWKDKLFAMQLSNADALETIEVKNGIDEFKTPRKRLPSNAAALRPAKVKNETPKKRKIGKSGFKYPPKMIAGIKAWGGDDLSDSGDEAVREYKKIKLEHEKDNDLFLSSVPYSQAPASQASMVEEEDISTEQTLTTRMSAKKKMKLKDENDDGLFFFSSSQNRASGQRASDFEADSGTRDFVKTQNGSSRSFERVVSPATVITQNSPSRPPYEKFSLPNDPSHGNQLTHQDTSTRYAAKQSARPPPPHPQQPPQPQTSKPHTAVNPSPPSTQSPVTTLYIGNPHTTFPIPTSSLPLSPHLLTKLSHDPTLGAYIMSPLLARIPPQDFGPIATYLNGSDPVASCLVTQHPGTDPAEDFKKCAMTDHIATQLGIHTLAIAASRSTAAIRLQPTASFLHVVAYLLRQGVLYEGGALRAVVVMYLAKWYWELERMEGAMLGEVLELEGGLGEEVLESLEERRREWEAI